MRLVFNIILLLIAAALAYMLYQSIEEPIAFKAEKDRRKEIVVQKLDDIRTAQKMYRDITGFFAPNFDSLANTLTTGQFMIVSVDGDPDDPNFTGEITYDTTFLPAIDSVQSLGMDLEALRYVPVFEDTKPKPGESPVEFMISADTIDYQATQVAVVEVGTPWNTFMGEYSSQRFKKYDQKYNPRGIIKFGDLNKPNLSGNWE